MEKDEILEQFEWADVIHYHNRWKRQQIFTMNGLKPPKKPSVIQMHSPRFDSENFVEEADSGIPIAVIAQYHVRQWPELDFIVPNVVDIYDGNFQGKFRKELRQHPLVSYAPSNCTARDWNSKGYHIVAPILKRLRIAGKIQHQIIVQTPHEETLLRKRNADIGIDEFVTGSYHLSSLEYLSMGIACFCWLDDRTERVVRDLTGSVGDLPWTQTTRDSFKQDLNQMISDRSWEEKGRNAREWVEKFWNPEILSDHYIKMYERL